MWLKTLGDVGFIASGLGTVVFALTYSVVARWWLTIAGRIIWSFAASVAIIMMLAIVVLVFGPGHWIVYARPIVYAVLATVIWIAEIALIRVQVLRRRAKKKD